MSSEADQSRHEVGRLTVRRTGSATPERDQRPEQPVQRSQQAIAERQDEQERQPLEQPDAGDARLGQEVRKKPIERRPDRLRRRRPGWTSSVWRENNHTGADFPRVTRSTTRSNGPLAVVDGSDDVLIGFQGVVRRPFRPIAQLVETSAADGCRGRRRACGPDRRRPGPSGRYPGTAERRRRFRSRAAFMKPSTVPRGVSRPSASLGGSGLSGRRRRGATRAARLRPRQEPAPATPSGCARISATATRGDSLSMTRRRLSEPPPQNHDRARSRVIGARIRDRRRRLPRRRCRRASRARCRSIAATDRDRARAAARSRALSQNAFMIRCSLQAVAPHLGAERQAVRLRTPVRLQQLDAVPRGRGLAEHVGEADALRARASRRAAIAAR